MVAVICLAALWLIIAITDTMPTLVRLGVVSIGMGYVVSWYIPVCLKNRHVRSQNRLLDRCRALLILGSQALGVGNKAAAEKALRRIRSLEQIWRLGNCIPFRLCLALWSIAWAVIASVLIRYAGSALTHYGWTGRIFEVKESLSDLWLAMVISMTAPLHALVGYMEAWANPLAIGDCGDRLWQLIYGPRGIEVARDQTSADVPNFDGMTPWEIFGLGQNFTLHELNQARRILVRTLHPDRWQSASSHERGAREEALKRVNAAYDVLRKQRA